jgi:chorismate--pyruvate lyase
MLRTHLAWQNKPLRSADSTTFIPWLQDRGSLTARLQTKGRFTLRLQQQSLGTPTHEDARALNIQPNKLAWIREVVLLCDEIPLVFAHTVLPYRPRGPMTGWMARLGDRSLGALLFSRAGFKRGAIECKRLDHRHRLFQPAIAGIQMINKPPSKLWARRSRFVFGAQTVLVTEIFSPNVGFNSREKQRHKKINRY